MNPIVNHIARVVSDIRPDWDHAGIVKFLDQARVENRTITPAELALASIRCAMNLANRTPAVIVEQGPHWRDQPVEQHGVQPTLGQQHLRRSGPSYNKPPWCGQCEERTRLAERPDGRFARCPACHPLATVVTS